FRGTMRPGVARPGATGELPFGLGGKAVTDSVAVGDREHCRSDVIVGGEILEPAEPVAIGGRGEPVHADDRTLGTRKGGGFFAGDLTGGGIGRKVELELRRGDLSSCDGEAAVEPGAAEPLVGIATALTLG